MKSLCVTSLIFTLEGKAVENNEYLPIFMMYLSQLIRCGGLGKGDCLTMLIDKPTLAYLQEKTIFNALLSQMVCEKKVYTIETPKSILEGMMKKYLSFKYIQDIYLYLDIDIFVTQNLRNLVEDMPDNTIRVCKEGLMKELNYSADLTSEYEITDNMSGYSAGKFACSSNDVLDNFFKNIHSYCNKDDGYYTVEQPFFNHAILASEKYLKYDYFEDKLISFNGTKYKKGESVLFDCAGEPGKGEVHFKKMLSVLMLLNSSFL